MKVKKRGITLNSKRWICEVIFAASCALFWGEAPGIDWEIHTVNRCRRSSCSHPSVRGLTKPSDVISAGRSSEGWRSWPNWPGQTEVAVLFQPQWPCPVAPVAPVSPVDGELRAARLEVFGVGVFVCLPRLNVLLDGDWWSYSWCPLKYGGGTARITLHL